MAHAPGSRLGPYRGAEARWRTDGRELYVLALDGTMMAVDVTLTPRPALSAPRVLFERASPSALESINTP